MIRLLTLALVVALSGCATMTRPVAVKAAPVSVPVIQPVHLSPVQFEACHVGTRIDFGLSDSGVHALEDNLISMQRYMRDQRSVIDMLESVDKARSQGQKSGAK